MFNTAMVLCIHNGYTVTLLLLDTVKPVHDPKGAMRAKLALLVRTQKFSQNGIN
jgi:hypothetical protein